MAKKGYFIPVKFFVTTFTANKYRPRSTRFETYMEDDYRSFNNEYINLDSSFAFVRQIDKDYDEKSVRNTLEQRLNNMKRGSAYPYNKEFTKEAEIVEVDNVPKSGFKIVTDHRGAGIKVLSPDGYVLEVNSDNYKYILNKCELKGGGNHVEILDECCLGILAQKGGEIALIPKSTPFYTKASRFSESLEDKIDLRSVKRGNIVNTTHTEGDVKYLGGWYFSAIDQKWLITNGGTDNQTFVLQPDQKIMNIRRRYVTMDKKSVLTGDYQKIPESHTQVIVSKIVDDTELSKKDAEELIDKVMSAKILSKRDSTKHKDYYTDGYRALLEHMVIEQNYYNSSANNTPNVGPTLLVKKTFAKKPKMWDNRFLLERKSDLEMTRFMNSVVNDSNFLNTDGVFLLKDKISDHWLILAGSLRWNYGYNVENKIGVHKIDGDGDIEFHDYEVYRGARYPEIRRRMFLVDFNSSKDQTIVKKGDDYVVEKNKQCKQVAGVFTPLINETMIARNGHNVKQITYKIVEPINVLTNLSQFEMYEFKVGIDNKFYPLSQPAK